MFFYRSKARSQHYWQLSSWHDLELAIKSDLYGLLWSFGNQNNIESLLWSLLTDTPNLAAIMTSMSINDRLLVNQIMLSSAKFLL